MEESTKVETEHPLATALRTELLALLAPPLTLKSIGKARQMLDAAQRAMAVVSGDRLRVNASGYVQALGEYSSSAYSPDVEPSFSGGVGVNLNAETYGATVLRELVPFVAQHFNKKDNDDPVKLVQAIAAAREAELPDLETILRVRLGQTTGAAVGMAAETLAEQVTS